MIASNKLWIRTLAALAALAAFATPRIAGAVRIPVVGCTPDGQVAPLDASADTEIDTPFDPATAEKLAIYRAE